MRSSSLLVFSLGLVACASTPDPTMTAEFAEAQAARDRGYPWVATSAFMEMFEAGKSGRHFKDAAIQLVELSRGIPDTVVIPSFFDRTYTRDYATLGATLNDVNFLVIVNCVRRGRGLEARDFSEAITKSSPHRPRAEALRAEIETMGKPEILTDAQRDLLLTRLGIDGVETATEAVRAERDALMKSDESPQTKESYTRLLDALEKRMKAPNKSNEQ